MLLLRLNATFPFLLVFTVISQNLAQGNLDLESWRKSVAIMNLAQINSEKDDYAPTFYRDGIVYPSSRRKQGPIDRTTGDTFHDLYFAPIESKGIKAKPSNFSFNINSQWHESASSFEASQRTIYFTRTANRGRQNKGKEMWFTRIFEASMGDNDWENIREMSFNNGDFNYMHPSVSPAGDRLFFASDMAGGFGETDIFMVERLKDNTWSRPINLGNSINTSGKEAFPFIHDSGVLFFASTGHPGYGGYDIFMINLADPDERVINLGSPFNSGEDDFSLILDAYGEKGYFTSNRSGGMGKDDIYSFQALNGIKSMTSTFNLRSTIQVMNEQNNAPVPLADIRIFEQLKDGYSEEIYEYKYVADPNNPEHRILQKILKSEENITQPPVRTNRRGEVVQTLRAEKKYLILVSKSGFETQEFVYSTIGKIEAERIEILLHPISCFDLNGTILSSSTNPIPYANIQVTNKCNNKVRQFNSNQVGQFIYCLEEGCDFLVEISKAGFENYQTVVSTKNIRGVRSKTLNVNLEINQSGISNMPIKAGAVAILEDIYYDFGDYEIKSSATKELNELVQLMEEYPSIKIELIAHTDSRGEAFYNMELSQKRAQAAKQYLINRGIQHHRINTFGFGESRIRNHCTDGINCSEEEHQFNRRTEVRIIEVGSGDKLQINGN